MTDDTRSVATLRTERKAQADREARAASPVHASLLRLATEFDECCSYYQRFTGAHNWLLVEETRRCAAQLRLVAQLVREGSYTQTVGADWVLASWRIITAIGRANIR